MRPTVNGADRIDGINTHAMRAATQAIENAIEIVRFSFILDLRCIGNPGLQSIITQSAT